MSAARGPVRALLADCKADPFEDRLRLILADWLDEFGDESDRARAEVIRCQIDPEREDNGRRARQLVARHAAAWLGPLREWDRAGTVERGLVALTLSAAALGSRALAAYADQEVWAWVEEVRLSRSGDDIARLTASPLLASVTSIGFTPDQLDAKGAAILSDLPWLSRIARLDLTHQPIEDYGLAMLLRSAHIGAVRELNLSNAGLPSIAGGLLAVSSLSARLRHLGLMGNALGDRGVIELTGQGPLPALRSLSLRGCGVRDAGAEALAGGALPVLRTLDLRDNGIGPKGAEALAESECFGQIESLVLYGNPVGAAGAARLVERFGNRVSVTPAGG